MFLKQSGSSEVFDEYFKTMSRFNDKQDNISYEPQLIKEASRISWLAEMLQTGGRVAGRWSDELLNHFKNWKTKTRAGAKFHIGAEKDLLGLFSGADDAARALSADRAIAAVIKEVGGEATSVEAFFRHLFSNAHHCK